MYCDASEKAIAAAAYLVLDLEDRDPEISFVMGKSKVAPAHGTSIPRLELCGALLGAEIGHFVTKNLDIQTPAKYYVDSKVVLGYICNRSRRFYTYVAIRVEKILNYTHSDQWNYVPTSKNPADCGTRGVPADQLLSSPWLIGPTTLPQSDESGTTYDVIDPESDKEVRPKVIAKATSIERSQKDGLGTSRFSRFSTLDSLVRAISTLHHAAVTFRGKSDNSCDGWHLCSVAKDADHQKYAESLIIREVQREFYNAEYKALCQGKQLQNDSTIIKLSPFLDNEGIMRINGRLDKSDISYNQKHPIIIPGKHHVAKLIVRHYHNKVYHQGRHLTEGAIRTAGYWVTVGKRLVSSVIHHCVICRKLRGVMETHKMADLPADRLMVAPPFTYVGVDTFSPWQVVSRRTRASQSTNKRWAILFTCLVVRAIHIEVVDELSTSAFINALRRFVSIRGPVKEFRSDRGTNFVGATDPLGISAINVEQPEIQHYFHQNEVSWKFNPPHGSHFGGAWERMIGVSRRILEAMMMKVPHLTHDVLVTFMAEVCAIVNSRPIVPVSTDPENPEVLTPARLLTQKPLCGSGHSKGDIDTKDMYRKQWRQVSHLSNTFWARWKNEFLSSLQKRCKWQHDKNNLSVGDIVLLRDKSVSRIDWPIGRVKSVYPSDDGKVRKVEVSTYKNGKVVSLVRPIVELVLLLNSE